MKTLENKVAFWRTAANYTIPFACLAFACILFAPTLTTALCGAFIGTLLHMAPFCRYAVLSGRLREQNEWRDLEERKNAMLNRLSK